MEIWKAIKGYEGLYEISNIGRVKSFKFCKERILMPVINTHGYYCISLYKNRVIKNKKIHKLVAVAFLNHISCGFELVINHINFIKTDNRVENLEIVTTRENSNKKHLQSSSQYTGVSLYKRYNTWRASIRINGKEKNLGCFKTEIEASNAYQNELKKLNLKIMKNENNKI